MQPAGGEDEAFEKESAQNFSKANPPCKEHGVPAAPAKQNPGCPEPVPSLGWKAHHTPFPRSWGWWGGMLPLALCQQVTRVRWYLAASSSQGTLDWTISGGRERWGGTLCAGPSRGKDAVQGARTVLSPSLATWNLRGPRLGLETPGGLKGCLDLPGQCPEAKLSEENTQARRPLSWDNDLALPGWALGVYKVEGRKSWLGLFMGEVL